MDSNARPRRLTMPERGPDLLLEKIYHLNAERKFAKFKGTSLALKGAK
jgi:hypothetical protein